MACANITLQRCKLFHNFSSIIILNRIDFSGESKATQNKHFKTKTTTEEIHVIFADRFINFICDVVTVFIVCTVMGERVSCDTAIPQRLGGVIHTYYTIIIIVV